MSSIRLRDVSKLITKGTTPTSVGANFTSAGINFVNSESIDNSKYLNNGIFEHID
jgi:type I restriction enzyme, S subunit